MDPLDLVIAGLMLVFGLFELSKTEQASLPSNWMIPWRLDRGFFGGLSGHQGALRSVFLLRSGLSRKPSSPRASPSLAGGPDARHPPAQGGLLTGIQEQWLLLSITTLAACMRCLVGTETYSRDPARRAATVGGLDRRYCCPVATGII
ncbi:MAG: hypothetical protein IPM46_14065 [Flavobacteriales bacterium]|nr:hypothetical protein [Flavobacteriales bacterium]